jgi:hypothetical protein
MTRQIMELNTRSAELGSSHVHFFLGNEYYEEGDLRKVLRL